MADYIFDNFDISYEQWKNMVESLNTTTKLIYVEPNSTRWLSLENLPNELWKDIEGFDGIYQISNYGRVKSLERTRKLYSKDIYVPEIIRKNGYDKDGYQIIPLNKDSKKHMKKIHRLVAEAFIPNYFNKQCVDHINCKRNDNRVNNLRWVTVRENNMYCYKNGNMFDISKYIKTKKGTILKNEDNTK